MQVYRRSQHCSSHRNTHKTQAIMELRQAKPLSANCCSWIITLMMLITSPSLLCAEPDTQIFRVDPLALLSGTLRTYQRAGCDRELVTLSCPRGTSISIEIAQYGRSGDANERNLCPASTEDALDISIPGTEIEIKAPESCTWPNALQYSLLQTVVEACQKKRHCKFLASPKTFGGDPCPGQRKFVEVAYKCRPYEFRSKIACENDVIQLICNPYSRIAIYSANYGRTEYESLQCAQPQGVKEENCLASYATETVMQKCHGRRKCTLSADSTTFGKPCRPDSRMYLKVVYTCVPRKVLKDRFEAAPEPDEPLQSDLEQDQDELYDEDQFFRESDAAPPGPAPKLQGGPTNGRVSDVPGYAGTSSSSSTPASPPRSIHDIMDDSDFSFGEGRSIEVAPSNGTADQGRNRANQRNPIAFPETHNEPSSTFRVRTDKKLVVFSKPPSSPSSTGRAGTLPGARQHPGVAERNEASNGGFGMADDGDSPRHIEPKPSNSDRTDYPLLFAWWEIRLFVERKYLLIRLNFYSQATV
ncbi:uncharacterized protein LOC121603668 isoform X3 [Anopheles merus]|uniref:uncharacterized protein LOC121603668 isoform X3 n=1 Tax=Anopheles merus TaxID=30066 RepID=UPI001BE4B977|nr:uncharacterized protein LOC121603668 isoform X3 [Anopheles merus]